MTTHAPFEPGHPRDLAGYGPTPPHPHWPGDARIAVQFVLNYEEGGENSVLHGDPASETFLSEIVAAQPFPARHMSMESLYEYGSRAGVWRVLRLFRERRLPLTVFGVGMALARNPAVVDAFMADGHEIASHGWRWISYQQIDEDTEREHMRLAIDTIARLTGSPPDGWYTGRDSPNTRRLVVEQGGFTYYADSYADDLPYYLPVQTHVGVTPLLVVPYTLDANDARFATPQGFNSGDQFFTYLKDAFDVLYAEGDPQGQNAPKMMSVGLHCRLVGHPGRAAALARFLDYVRQHDACGSRAASTSRAIGSRRIRQRKLKGDARRDKRDGQKAFVGELGGIFEHSPWVAERAFSDRPFASVDALHAAMVAAVARAPEIREAGAAARASGACRQGGGARRAHRRFQQRAIGRGTFPVFAGGICAADRAQSPLQREIRIPVHSRGERI